MVILEIKNNCEIIEEFNCLDNVINSSIGWLEVYEDIDKDSGHLDEKENYSTEIEAIKKAKNINSINEIMGVFGYKYIELFDKENE